MNYPEDVCLAIRSYFATQGIDQQEAANRLGVSQQAVSVQLRGNRAFGLNTARKWAQCFGFSYSWLRTGVGPMIEGQPYPSEPAKPDATPDLVAYAEAMEEIAGELAKETARLKTLVFRLADKMKKAGIPTE